MIKFDELKKLILSATLINFKILLLIVSDNMEYIYWPVAIFFQINKL